MKTGTAFLLSLLFVIGSLAQAQARRDVLAGVHGKAFHSSPLLARPGGAPPLAGAPQLVASPTATAAAHPANVMPKNCPEPNSFCGYVSVPLDRNRPQGPKINIYFEQYFHSNPGPVVSAIMVNGGGPGFTTTDNRDYFQFVLFAANMDAHDLLLVDDRGRGQSAAIDCKELQHGRTDFATAETDCAARLGPAASRYGSGDIAEDMNDVRAALGYEIGRAHV